MTTTTTTTATAAAATTFNFVLTGLLSNITPGFAESPMKNFSGFLLQVCYKPDTLPVIQSTVSKH